MKFSEAPNKLKMETVDGRRRLCDAAHFPRHHVDCFKWIVRQNFIYHPSHPMGGAAAETKAMRQRTTHITCL